MKTIAELREMLATARLGYATPFIAGILDHLAALESTPGTLLTSACERIAKLDEQVAHLRLDLCDHLGVDPTKAWNKQIVEPGEHSVIRDLGERVVMYTPPADDAAAKLFTPVFEDCIKLETAGRIIQFRLHKASEWKHTALAEHLNAAIAAERDAATKPLHDMILSLRKSVANKTVTDLQTALAEKDATIARLEAEVTRLDNMRKYVVDHLNDSNMRNRLGKVWDMLTSYEVPNDQK